MIYSRETEQYLNQFFFTGSWPGIVWMKYYLSNFGSIPLSCDPALFPGKNTPNIAKTNYIFPEKGEGNKDFILIYLNSSIADVFPPYYLFFSILTLFSRKRGVKVGPNVLTSGPYFFHKYSNPSKISQTVFLFAKVLLLVRISEIFEHIVGVMGQKPSKKELGILT